MNALKLVAAIGVMTITQAVSAETNELAQWQAQAARGDRDAQFNLGAAYLRRIGASTNKTVAAEWFKKAAEQGHEVAQFALGMMYLNGEGLCRDPAAAAKWVAKAADQGYAPAQDELAIMYSNGTGVQQNDQDSLKWAGKSAEQGYPPAQYHLGFFLCCKTPSTVKPDNVSACVWFELAAAAGHEKSRVFLAALRAQMQAAQLEEVKKRVEQWKSNHQNSAWR